jgi:CHAT domain-containing protein
MLLDLGPDTILETLKDQKKHLNNYNQLYKTYWEKLDVQLEGIESLVLVMNGVYQKINPMVLQDNEGIFLVDKYEIDILFSVLDLYFDGFEVNIDTRNITLIGNPSFTIDSTLIVNTENKEFIDLNRGGSGNKSWITLPGTGSEVNDIKEAFYNYEYNVDLVTGNDATEAYVRSVSNPEILHLATHGFVNPKKNKYSNGLVFSGANDTQEWDPKDKDDGYLMAEDILQMNLVGTKLVALSACETGLFNTEALDFRNAFVMAGAKHILVSLWKIDDKATRDLMTRFYSSLAQTNRIRMSFQDTQNYMKEKYKNPYYWGSFILISTSLDTQLN